MSPRFVGAHVPTSKGLGNAVREGHRYGCTAIQVFTSSPRMWKSSPAADEKIEDLKKARAETGIDALISHDTYLVNLCHPEDEVSKKSLDTLRDEVVRCAAYNIPFVVSHMGGLMGQDCEVGLKRIAEATCEILASTPEHVTLCMETTAGQGSSINSRFEELARLFELCPDQPRLAVCLDTCHVFAAGYDIRTEETYTKTFADFERLIGLDRLKVIHCNDSKKAFGTRVDRHENIGKGHIGPEAFRLLMNDPRFFDTPIVLETPTENEGHETDLAFLRSLTKPS